MEVDDGDDEYEDDDEEDVESDDNVDGMVEMRSSLDISGTGSLPVDIGRLV